MILTFVSISFVRCFRTTVARRTVPTAASATSWSVGAGNASVRRLVVFARFDARIQIVQARRVVAYLLGERMSALRRQVDVGQRSLPPPGSSAWSTELVGGVLDAHAIDVIRCGDGVRVSEAQNGWTVCVDESFGCGGRFFILF